MLGNNNVGQSLDQDWVTRESDIYVKPESSIGVVQAKEERELRKSIMGTEIAYVKASEEIVFCLVVKVNSNKWQGIWNLTVFVVLCIEIAALQR